MNSEILGDIWKIYKGRLFQYQDFMLDWEGREEWKTTKAEHDLT